MTMDNDFLKDLKKAKRRDDLIQQYSTLIYFESLVDWKKVNKAIIDKWSRSGLMYIKRKAWRRLNERNTT